MRWEDERYVRLYTRDTTEAKRLADVLRTSGRLRHEDHLTLARALGLVLDRRSDFDADPTEALVQAVATLAVVESVR